jgi:ABC-2 type transport system permease protein
MSAPTLALGFDPSLKEPRPSNITQWWVLTTRFIKPTLRNGELITAIGASLAFTAGIYIPFSVAWNRFVGGGSSGVAGNMGQYVTPLVILQAVGFAAISSAFRAAIDSQQGVNRRFSSMPMAPLTPVLARVSASVYRCCIGLVSSLICCYVIGFRFHRGAIYIVGFCLLVIAIGAVLSYNADLLGTATKNPDAMLPLLTLPILIFGLLSVGLMPLRLFPLWVHPFVRNQPISQFVMALRALAGDTTKKVLPVSWPVMAPTLVWLVSIVVILIPTSIYVLSRRS